MLGIDPATAEASHWLEAMDENRAGIGSSKSSSAHLVCRLSALMNKLLRLTTEEVVRQLATFRISFVQRPDIGRKGVLFSIAPILPLFAAVFPVIVPDADGTMRV